MSDRRRAGVRQRFFGFWLLRFRSRAVCISGETLQRLKSPENQAITPISYESTRTISQWMRRSIHYQPCVVADPCAQGKMHQLPLLRHIYKKCHNATYRADAVSCCHLVVGWRADYEPLVIAAANGGGGGLAVVARLCADGGSYIYNSSRLSAYNHRPRTAPAYFVRRL